MTHTSVFNKELDQKPLTETRIGDNFIPDFLLQSLNCPVNIYDYQKRKIVFANERFTELVGISLEKLTALTLDEFNEWIHPDDLDILQNEVAVRLAEVCKKNFRDNETRLIYSVNFRLREEKGERFRQLMTQCTILEWDENKFPALALNIHTDITDHKKDCKIVFKASIYNKSIHAWEPVAGQEYLHRAEELSGREREIMNLMASGKRLKQVSESLNISYLTVRTHCRNMLEKTHCKSQDELKSRARLEGWV